MIRFRLTTDIIKGGIKVETKKFGLFWCTPNDLLFAVQPRYRFKEYSEIETYIQALYCHRSELKITQANFWSGYRIVWESGKYLIYFHKFFQGDVPVVKYSGTDGHLIWTSEEPRQVSFDTYQEAYQCIMDYGYDRKPVRVYIEA